MPYSDEDVSFLRIDDGSCPTRADRFSPSKMFGAPLVSMFVIEFTANGSLLERATDLMKSSNAEHPHAAASH